MAKFIRIKDTADGIAQYINIDQVYLVTSDYNQGKETLKIYPDPQNHIAVQGQEYIDEIMAAISIKKT